MADDLDDEWWLSNTNSNKHPSDEESDIEETAKVQDASTEEVKDSEDSDSNSEIVTPGKRKLTKSDSKTNKKQKKKRKTITDVLKEKGNNSRGTSTDILQMIQKNFEGKLAAVEWDDLQLDLEDDFHPCSEEDHTATSYLRTILPKWKKLMKESELKPGSPLLLVITSSAIRAVNLNREIHEFKSKDCKCAKLFAKHFKLGEQQKYLSKQTCHMGIGTPNRINSLLKSGSLHLDNVTSVVLDWNWRDVKLKRLVDIQDVKKELLSLLQTYIIPHVHHTKCKIGIL